MQQSKRPTFDPISVSPTDAAHMIGVSVMHFQRHVMPFVRSGNIQSYRIGRRVCIDVESLRRWLEEQKQ
jgi:excisionase family DNA binding protein